MELCAGGKSSMRVPKPETTQAEEGESTPTHQAETVPPEEAGSSLKNQTQRTCALFNKHLND